MIDAKIDRKSRKFREIETFDLKESNQYFLLPFRFHRVTTDKEIIVNEVGDYLILQNGTFEKIVKRQINKEIDAELYGDLIANFFISEEAIPPLIDVLATRYRTKKLFLNYFTGLHIFVISLRCEHTCHYCQVSRVTQNRDLYDMSISNIDKGIDIMFKSPNSHLTMEFQGGEALLAFYSNVATASFACNTPQLLVGPDGFPYFILKTPENDKPFESFCIQNMKDDFLLDRGWGVVLNPAADKSADWVFTHGDIVSLHLNNEFATATDPAAIQNIEFTKTVGTLKKEEKVMIAQPSADYLPFATRHALKLFLQIQGVKRPKVMMLSSYIESEVIRKLVFNIHPENYPVTAQLDYLMQQVGWFLPRQYIIIPLSKKSSLAAGFCDL